jgi:hypothetical protein
VRIDVPAATASFGALIPLSATQQPTIDSAPIPAEAFVALDDATRPRFVVGHGGGSDGGFIGCGAPDLSGAGANDARGNVIESPAVVVGPVVAQYVLADDTAALATWLAARGFTLPEGGDAIVSSYVAAGAGFLAFTRADDAAASAPTSIGVHFSVPGDLRSVALRMVQMGAPDVLPLTFFVAHAEAVGPAAPWHGILLEDLEDAALDYVGAIDAATAATPAGQLFVFENLAAAADLVASGDPRVRPLAALLDDGALVTRLSARLPREALASDVAFTGERPLSRAAASAAAVRLPRSTDLAVVALGAGLLAIRRRRR